MQLIGEGKRDFLRRLKRRVPVTLSSLRVPLPVYKLQDANSLWCGCGLGFNSKRLSRQTKSKT